MPGPDQQALLRVRATTFRFGYHHIYHLDGHGPVPIDDTFIHPQRCPHFLFRTEPMVYPGRITTGQESRSAGG